jgi:hypothetical protein
LRFIVAPYVALSGIHRTYYFAGNEELISRNLVYDLKEGDYLYTNITYADVKFTQCPVVVAAFSGTVGKTQSTLLKL